MWGIAGSSRWSCAPRSCWPPVITPRWASPGQARWERESSSPRGGHSRLWAMAPFNGMLEAIDRPRNYYARRSWDYTAMARTLGASAERVTTPAELEGAMARAEADPGAVLIEAVTARDDLSPVMARIRAHLHTPPKPRSL